MRGGRSWTKATKRHLKSGYHRGKTRRRVLDQSFADEYGTGFDMCGSNMGDIHRMRAYRSRLKRWGVFKYNHRRRNSVATEQTSASEGPVYLGDTAPQPLDMRRVADSPLNAHHDFLSPGIFGTESTADEDM